MNALLISYDLGVPETSEDYKRLIAYLEGYDSWAKPLYSVWIIKTAKTSGTVRDEIKAIVDSNDKVLVVNVSGDGWASYNLPTKVTEWMKSNI